MAKLRRPLVAIGVAVVLGLAIGVAYFIDIRSLRVSIAGVFAAVVGAVTYFLFLWLVGQLATKTMAKNGALKNVAVLNGIILSIAGFAGGTVLGLLLEFSFWQSGLVFAVALPLGVWAERAVYRES